VTDLDNLFSAEVRRQLNPLLHSRPYTTFGHISVITEQNLNDKALFEALPVQEMAAIIGFERAAKQLDGAASQKFTESEVEALVYLRHNFPYSANAIASDPDNECPIAWRDPTHARIYSENSGLYRSGAAWPREVLYRAQVYLNAAREQYYPQGTEPPSLPLRFQDKSVLNHAINWISAHSRCKQPSRLMRHRYEP
jgi:hypothetical protein